MAARADKTNLGDRIVVRVDPAAEPADWDAALAVFLSAFVRQQATRSAGTAAAVAADDNTSAVSERQTA